LSWKMLITAFQRVNASWRSRRMMSKTPLETVARIQLTTQASTILAIAFIVGGDGANVALKTELAESRVEEEAPLAEVAFVHVEDDRDMVANGDALNPIGVGRDDFGVIIGGVGVDRHGWGLRKQ